MCPVLSDPVHPTKRTLVNLLLKKLCSKIEQVLCGPRESRPKMLGPICRVFLNSYTQIQCLPSIHLPPTEENHRKTESKRMRKFDPWPVFFKREFNRNWPFLVGFAITGTIITKFSLSLTGTYPFYFSHSSDQRPSNSDLLIVWIFFCGRGRQEKLRLCPKTQEVRHKTPQSDLVLFNFCNPRFDDSNHSLSVCV